MGGDPDNGLRVAGMGESTHTLGAQVKVRLMGTHHINFVMFTSENIVFHVIATEVAISEAITV